MQEVTHVRFLMCIFMVLLTRSPLLTKEDKTFRLMGLLYCVHCSFMHPHDVSFTHCLLLYFTRKSNTVLVLIPYVHLQVWLCCNISQENQTLPWLCPSSSHSSPTWHKDNCIQKKQVAWIDNKLANWNWNWNWNWNYESLTHWPTHWQG